ncbi:diguanylate cyclase domain-containing protein [Nitrincola schmidtii]|uniref:diguanylate cyclase domain-containing protein n=1 Tax=Nitrincola schmidtii TaxID=1730894 RepID=UPI00124D470F|nr:diguanylate cyclase [Nitrincola schmidtii]
MHEASRPSFAVTNLVLIKIFLATFLYLLLTWIILTLFSPDRGATLFYLTTGYALAIVLLGGRVFLLSVLIGSLTANLILGDPLFSSLIGACGSAGSAWLGSKLIGNINNFDKRLTRLKDTLHIFVYGGLIGCVISPLAGTSMLLIRGIIEANDIVPTMATWWLGDVLGVVLLTPAILLWADFIKTRRTLMSNSSIFEERLFELVSLFSLTFLISCIIFFDLGRLQLDAPKQLWLDLVAEPYWLFPLVIWSSLRFHQRMVSILIIMIGGIAIMGAYQGLGAFHAEDLSASLISYWGFMVILSITALLLNAFLAERREVEQQLHNSILALNQMANYDALTGLPNRSLLLDRLQQTLAYSRRHQSTFALLFIDLDGFKQVNDQFGHGVGDELLKAVSKRMRKELREIDTLSRIGGDEFVVLMQNINKQELEFVAQRLLKSVAMPILIDQLSIQISASIGARLNNPDTQHDHQSLLNQVDQAMYRAKAAGKNNYIID